MIITVIKIDDVWRPEQGKKRWVVVSGKEKYGIFDWEMGEEFEKNIGKEADVVIMTSPNGQWKSIQNCLGFRDSQAETASLKDLSSSLPGKDTLIVRQSCLKAAVEYYGHHGDDAKSDKLLEIAEKFEKWVLRK